MINMKIGSIYENACLYGNVFSGLSWLNCFRFLFNPDTLDKVLGLYTEK